MKILTKELLSELYLSQKMTDIQIAAQIGCLKTSVYKARKRHGIKSLKKWERKDFNLTIEQEQIILGCLLGDGSISNGKKSNGKKGYYGCESIFEVKHGPKQKEYLFWKYEKLKNLCKSEPKEMKNGQWRLRTFHHPYFSALRRKWYPNDKKTIPSQLNLSDLSIAVWYMDDGSISKQSNFLKLHTCSFSKKDHLKLIEILFNFGIKSEMKIYSGYKNLIIDLDSRKRFVNLIKGKVHESMKYKITFREYGKWGN
jgi:hypothetical protein